MVFLYLDRINAVLATQFDRSALGLRLADPFDNEFLEIGLLKIDESGKLVSLFREQVELENLAVIVEHFA